MKIELELKPCPWCKFTPNLYMPIGQDTWIWQICCERCNVAPSCSVSIRKSAKTNFARFCYKVKELQAKWNGGNPMPAYEKKVIDLKEILDGFDPESLPQEKV